MLLPVSVSVILQLWKLMVVYQILKRTGKYWYKDYGHLKSNFGTLIIFNTIGTNYAISAQSETFDYLNECDKFLF
jgi:hypothetical protein